MAGFILANGALSGGGEEYKIRKTLIENNLVEAILVLPRNLFYTTDISVTLWILNKNKKAHVKNIGKEQRNYRNREKEILFMDLRQLGEPFEKKFTQFSDNDIQKVVNTYHLWQTTGLNSGLDEAPASSIFNKQELVNSGLDSGLDEAPTIFNKLELAETQLVNSGLDEAPASTIFNKQELVNSGLEEAPASTIFNKQELAETQLVNSGLDEAPASTIFNKQELAETQLVNSGLEEAPASSIFNKQELVNSGLEEAPASSIFNKQELVKSQQYKDIPEFCYSATYEEVAKKDFSLVPSKYIEFVNRDENIDFDEKMQSLKTEFAELLKAEEASKKDLLTVFKELGYEINL